MLYEAITFQNDNVSCIGFLPFHKNKSFTIQRIRSSQINSQRTALKETEQTSYQITFFSELRYHSDLFIPISRNYLSAKLSQNSLFKRENLNGKETMASNENCSGGTRYSNN